MAKSMIRFFTRYHKKEEKEIIGGKIALFV